ncbi:MAG: purine nucleosidase [Halieaceae bacterium]|jgi:purine nucleosidase
MKRVIFDTDIGIDDAMALLFLHYAPQVALEAITTVCGNASIEDTTRNALYVAERFGIPAPVFRGAATPLGSALGEGYADFVHGKNGLGDIPLTPPRRREETLGAARAIIALAEANPGEISLVAVGRLTNLAHALEMAPELPKLLKEVVLMGGVFMRNNHQGNVSPVAEANIAGDPQAADRVFGSGLQLTVVGLDVTEETIMDEVFINSLRERAGEAGDFIHAISRFYFDFYEGINGQRQCPIHDSSAVAYLLQPSLYETALGPVRVVSEGIAMGQTILGEAPERYASDAWQNRPASRVCVAVNADAMRQLYLDTLARAGS